MYAHAVDQFNRLRDKYPETRLGGGLTGLEKESLRVGPDGSIARTPHPASLGSALTHPWITTDYSEALLEFITPPLESPLAALDFLRELQHYVYLKLDDELLWSASMPCVVEGEESIPLARYGNSNPGLMKTVYRRGLGYRYGRVMQVIAGAHYNYSFPDALWPQLQAVDGDTRSLQDYISDRYFGVIRNLQHVGWIVPYLFGSSPAVCKSFLCGKSTRLDEYNENSYYGPHATSLRMCDIGYQNSHEDEIGFKARYDNLDSYVDSLTMAIETNCPRYEKIGTRVDGEYRQLNTNMLQIENEYYSSVRPKQVPAADEKPTHALKRRGVRYVELRSLDINMFEPTGISATQCRFLETLMAFCLFQDSPVIDYSDRREIDANLDAVCYRGREPGLLLQRRGVVMSLQQWAGELCEAMMPFADALDTDDEHRPYRRALEEQVDAVSDPDKTYSARVLAGMRDHDEGYFHFAKRMSLQHQQYFLNLPVSDRQFSEFDRGVQQSIADQQAIEAADTLPFDKYLENYFSQTL
ncbi:MAG: glutamate--cysteine ligase [Gammaproteobacteria bacterium]|nr:glutamate--cysteine ligase [Gammaproteobacteria bacterium]